MASSVREYLVGLAAKPKHREEVRKQGNDVKTRESALYFCKPVLVGFKQ